VWRTPFSAKWRRFGERNADPLDVGEIVCVCVVSGYMVGKTGGKGGRRANRQVCSWEREAHVWMVTILASARVRALPGTVRWIRWPGRGREQISSCLVSSITRRYRHQFRGVYHCVSPATKEPVSREHSMVPLRSLYASVGRGSSSEDGRIEDSFWNALGCVRTRTNWKEEGTHNTGWSIAVRMVLITCTALIRSHCTVVIQKTHGIMILYLAGWREIEDGREYNAAVSVTGRGSSSFVLQKGPELPDPTNVPPPSTTTLFLK
jgi:hypothetical protein